MSHTDPITRMSEDANSDEIGAKVRATRARCAVTDAQLDLVIRFAKGGHIEHLRDELIHLRTDAYYNGKSDAFDVASQTINKTIGRYTDTGDGVLLAIIGPGGDFTTVVKP